MLPILRILARRRQVVDKHTDADHHRTARDGRHPDPKPPKILHALVPNHVDHRASCGRRMRVPAPVHSCNGHCWDQGSGNPLHARKQGSDHSGRGDVVELYSCVLCLQPHLGRSELTTLNSRVLNWRIECRADNFALSGQGLGVKTRILVQG